MNTNTELQDLTARLDRAEQQMRHAARRARLCGTLAVTALIGGPLLALHLPVQADIPGASLKALLSRLTSDETKINALQTKTAPISVAGSDLTVSGVNVHIVDGTGSTISTSGLGNLTIGYNQGRVEGRDQRTGSHNLILGDNNNYTSFGGLVAGYHNEISNIYNTVTGGLYNTASGYYASVSGGSSGTASGDGTSVTGGYQNIASGSNGVVTGGSGNAASGEFAVVSGGGNNTAKDQYASVSGGFNNTASALYATVSGGENNTADSKNAAVSGGESNTADGMNSSVSGGYQNEASGGDSSVSGGSGWLQASPYGWRAGNYHTP